jgi:hypothetical protein
VRYVRRTKMSDGTVGTASVTSSGPPNKKLRGMSAADNGNNNIGSCRRQKINCTNQL